MERLGLSGELGDQAYAILVMVALRGPSTAYELERTLEHFVHEYWAVPHTQVYRECDRLVTAGLLRANQESGGRRRRVYTLTPAGRTEVESWVRAPTARSIEIRDVAQLKLLASELSTTEDVRRLAEHQVEAYKERLRVLDEGEARFAGREDLALRVMNIPMGRAVYEAALAFWTRIARNPPQIKQKKPRAKK